MTQPSWQPKCGCLSICLCMFWIGNWEWIKWKCLVCDGVRSSVTAYCQLESGGMATDKWRFTNQSVKGRGPKFHL
jgi:hypothetical protein